MSSIDENEELEVMTLYLKTIKMVLLQRFSKEVKAEESEEIERMMNIYYNELIKLKDRIKVNQIEENLTIPKDLLEQQKQVKEKRMTWGKNQFNELISTTSFK